MRTHHLLLPLALLAAPGLAGPPLQSPSATAPAAPLLQHDSEGFEALETEFNQAAEDHKKELRRVKGEARRQLADQHPANAFWPRFQALADGGEGRALLWMVLHSRDRDTSIGDSRKEVAALYETLLEKHVAEPWFGDVVERLPRDRSSIGTEPTIAYLRAILAKNPSRDVQARALGALASQLARLGTPEATEESTQLFDRLASEYADTKLGAQAAAELRLKLGAVAPNFSGKTIDGYEFELEDYRGKVVLVDFYGFW